jgi:hypothetical protein
MKLKVKINKGDSFRLGIQYSFEKYRVKGWKKYEWFLLFDFGHYRLWIGLLKRINT